MCYNCPLRRTCLQICTYVEVQLPSMETGRVDHEDLQRLYQGMIMTRAILENVEILTPRQQQVVQMYFRENLQQQQIAAQLGITQQAVGDFLARARATVGRKLKSYVAPPLSPQEDGTFLK